MRLLCIAEGFGCRSVIDKTNIGKLLGLAKTLKKFASGSFANLYEYPGRDDILIKVTCHRSDVVNAVKAQRIGSNCIVKLTDWEDGKAYKELPSIKSWALLVEKIVGKPMIYSTGDFYTLCYNGDFDLAKDWCEAGGSDVQKQILKKYSFGEAELNRLSKLFEALRSLGRLRIELSDFEDNIMDSGDRYVIVDLGF